MPFCRSADPFRVKPWLAHTPQPDDPPPTEPGGPDVPPIGDPPPQPGEVPRSVGPRPAPLSRSPSPSIEPNRAAWMRWARWAGWAWRPAHST